MDIRSVEPNDLPQLLKLYQHLTPGDQTADLDEAADHLAALEKLQGVSGRVRSGAV